MLKYVIIVCVSLWMVDGAAIDLDVGDSFILNPVRSTQQDYCEYEGNVYQPGDKWDIQVDGGCGSYCRCRKGGSYYCTSSACPPAGCEVKGIKYHAGQTWTTTLEGGCAATCNCRAGGAWSCQSTWCPGNY